MEYILTMYAVPFTLWLECHYLYY